MAANLGAHEVMEVHEVLTKFIDGINTFQLLRPHAKDPQLEGMLNNQLHFMTQGYNNLVQMLNQQGMGQVIPYQGPKNITPTYGLNQPPTQVPNTSTQQMDDQDVALGLLCFHKASAALQMKAALECANPQIRRAIQQGAINCSEQAYEVWQYMNQRGFYQVPTMKEVTTNTMLGAYQQANTGTFQPAGMTQ
jgi:spore coat protein CotF